MGNWLRICTGLAAGAFCLWLINLQLDPVPVSALPAYVLGAAVLVFYPGRWRPGLLLACSTAGALSGILVHRHWHVTGLSPAPDNGLLTHLASEGLTGLVAALFCLAIASLVKRAGDDG